MDCFNIDPENDELGKRVNAARRWLALVRRQGTFAELDHFPGSDQ